MKYLYVKTKYEGELNLSEDLINQLPNKLVLTMPIQLIDFKDQIKNKLESSGKEVILFESLHGRCPGQILGCDVHKFPGDYDAFFYVGDGLFHPTALLYGNEKKVYCFNPFNDKLNILDTNYLTNLKKRRNGQFVKFLTSKKIGILVTTKFGQNRLSEAEKLRDKLEEIGKEVYFFIDDEINTSKLENFNFIESWINTACPRIVQDFNCLNIDDLKEIDIHF